MFRCGAQGCLLHDTHAEVTRHKYRGMEYIFGVFFSATLFSKFSFSKQQ